MKIKSITPVGRCDVFDISVEADEHYILDNGVASHNTGSYYGADNIFIIGRQQDKETSGKKDLLGYNFIINVEKSRYTREKSKIPITVHFDGGLSKWSGLLDMAQEAGFVIKPSKGYYSRVDLATGEVEDKKWKEKATDCADFWQEILDDVAFQIWVKNRYKVSAGTLMESTPVTVGSEDEST